MSTLRKVLVVDDDPVISRSFNRVLAGKGYIVVSAENGQDALNKVAKEEYDAVFTDIRMPGMDGLELAETLHARRPWTPVLIVTGYGTVADEARAKAAGVSAFLHKPLSPEMIEASTEQALREAAPAAEAAAVAMPAAETVVEAPVRESRIKNIALFIAAPFIGLAYAMFMPFVGLGMLAWIGGKQLAKRAAAREGGGAFATVAKIVFMPLVGLAYVIVLPFAGIAMLAWIAGRTLVGKAQAK